MTAATVPALDPLEGGSVVLGATVGRSLGIELTSSTGVSVDHGTGLSVIF